ncbi:MAG: NAD(P)/FAD-dependent oxidoreductase [Terriglobales bacterium]
MPRQPLHSDIIIAGAGLIGLALARELRRRGAAVTLFEAGLAARQASWAGAGMLSGRQTTDLRLRPLAMAGARLYPHWVRELEAETGGSVGYRSGGTLFLATAAHPAPDPPPAGWQRLPDDAVAVEEPLLAWRPAPGAAVWRIADHSLDNRALGSLLLQAVRAAGVLVHEHTPVEAITRDARGLSVRAAGAGHRAAFVINAAGAWAASLPAPAPPPPVRPRKGHMLSLRSDLPLRHVLETADVYLVPRAGGHIIIGSTVEDCGFDTSLDAAVIGRLRRRAATLVPALAGLPVEETWCGFRPGSADDLPIFGPTACPNYWLATGHFRDGILLAPITAKILAHALATGRFTRALDCTPFLPARFGC